MPLARPRVGRAESIGFVEWSFVGGQRDSRAMDFRFFSVASIAALSNPTLLACPNCLRPDSRKVQLRDLDRNVTIVASIPARKAFASAGSPF